MTIRFSITCARALAAIVMLTSLGWVTPAARGQSAVWLPAGATSGNIYYSGGNVGIGTTNPGASLDVAGTQVIALRINGTTGNAGSNNTQLRFAGGVSGELWALGTDEAANNGSKDFHFLALPNAGNVAAMTLQSRTGNVGIGTSSPAHTLEVVGTVGVQGTIISQEVMVSSTGRLRFRPGVPPTAPQ